MTTRNRFKRRALTFIELMMGGAILFMIVLLILIAILVPSMTRARELSRRTVCASNLKLIGNGFATYAAAYNDEWPIPAHLPADKDGVGRVRYAPGMIGAHRGRQNEPDAGETTPEDTEMSPTRAFWTLVRAGAVSPKSFVCPGSNDKPNTDDNPQDFWDFRKYSEISYGYQVPFGKLGKPGPNTDQDMALVAEKGPFGAALEAGKPDPGVPDVPMEAKPSAWKKFNSPNHGGEGQNVMYNDAHVDFVMTPLAGTGKDNIYTRWSSADGETPTNFEARIHGTPPTGIETPWGDADTLIYP